MFKASRFVFVVPTLVCTATLLAQSGSIRYPSARKGDVVDTYFGTRVPDPYRWMEDLNAPELKQWIDAENTIASRYLDALPVRDALKKRITELWNYPKVTPPRYEGRHWFYSRNSGLQRQSVVFTRETLGGTESVALDPNALSPDGSVALSGFVPAPDAQHFAYGQSEGGSDWSTYYVRELGSGKQLPDVIKLGEVQRHLVDRGRQRLLLRTVSGAAQTGKALEDAVKRQEDLLPPARHQPVGGSVDLRAARRAGALHRRRHSTKPAGISLFRPTRARATENELFVKDLVDPLAPKLDAPVRALYPGHTAAYDPLGVVNGTLYLRTDRDAPNRKIVSVPLDRSGRVELEDGRPRERRRDRDRAPRRRHARGQSRSSTSRARSASINLDGTPAGQIALAGSWRGQRAVRPLRTPGDLLHVHLAAVSGHRLPVRSRPAAQSTPFEPPKLTFDPSRYKTRARLLRVEGRHARADVHHAQEGI